jgi:glycosyltransferase involved in cell wall biosynthesis
MGNAAFASAEGLSRFGHRVEVFCPAYRRGEAGSPAPFPVHRLKPWLSFGNSAFLPQLSSRLAGFDLIDLHYPFFGGAEVVWLWKAARRRHPRLVLNYQMDNIGSGLRGWAFRAHARLVLPWILRAADRVIVLSYDYLEQSAARDAYRREPAKFTAIPVPVDTGRFVPREKNPGLLGRYGLSADDRVVLFVGGLDKAHAFKSVDFLLRTWRRLAFPRAKLILVGQGGLRPGYISLASRLGLSKSVLFADPVGEAELPRMYNLADLVVLPSLNSSEAFGIVLIEAMASGVPVVASSLPGVRRVFEDGREGLLFPPGDEDGLIAKLKRLLDDDGLRNRMAAAAREKAVAVYAREVVWEMIDRVFTEALT